MNFRHTSNLMLRRRHRGYDVTDQASAVAGEELGQPRPGLKLNSVFWHGWLLSRREPEHGVGSSKDKPV